MPVSSPPLTPTRVVRIREIFDGALERTEAERGAYLERACGGDPSLRSEVESLLSALERGQETWSRPFGAVLAEAIADADDAAYIGRRIGPYDVCRLIGYGGMGAVYEGVRADDQYHKQVAIKFLRRGMEGDLAIRRFRYERQILANLNHPNIASLLDGGVTPDGQPYFVMEYVDGEPITAYCARRALGVRARVELLRQVCAAVQHAHQHLVVHRDLKPGNILVAADGTVKLLDFGIARLLREGEGPDQLPMTQGGVRALTPDYASPEQVRGLPIATASDIYSLGVICCEVLAGRRPLVLAGKLFAEMQAIVCTTPAPAPSSLVTDAEAARRGERSAGRLRAQLAGDLDAIVLQALRKEPERRYGSAEQLSADLGRHLDGLPVSAQRDRLGYRLAKFIRRRRVEVGAATLVAASLVAGIVMTTRQAHRAERERAKVEQVNEFLAEMLAAADPGNDGRSVTVAQVLDEAARNVDRERLDPEIEAQIRHTIAQTYYGLGLYDQATTHARRAFELRRRVFGDRDMRTALSLSYVVAMAEARGAYVEAESLARLDVAMQRRMPTVVPAELATALDNLARTIELQGRLDEAMQVKLEALDIRRVSRDSVSLEAMPYTLNNLSVSYQYRGDFARAESLAHEALAVEAQVHGPRSVNSGNLLRNLASVLDEESRFAAADSTIRESIAILGAALGHEHTEYLRSVNMLATLRYRADDMRGAAAAAREVVGAIGRTLHESEPASSAALQVLGLALDSLGEHAAADSALRRSLALRRKYMPPDHWAIASSEAVLGYHLGLVGRNDDAERMMRAAYDKLAAARGADADVTKRVAVRLAELMTKLGRTRDAERWRARG
jgi:serine/threonine-protein kinase